jgi:hypothetical protein
VSSKWTGQRISGSSPLSRSDKIRLQTDQHCSKLLEKDEVPSGRGNEEDIDKEFFETSILSFMDSLNLQDKNLDDIQLIDVRKKMEQVQGRELTPQERRIFVAVVKKYVMSLKYSKSHDAKSHMNENIKTDICTKEEMVKDGQLTSIAELPHHISCDKKEQISVKRYEGKHRNVGTDWLTTRIHYPPEGTKISSPVAKSSAERRNVISLEDSDYTHQSTSYTREVNGKPESGSRCLNDHVVLQNTKKTLKRKLSETEGTDKRLPAANNSCLNTTHSCDNTDLQEDGANSEQSTGEDLIQCPVCKGGFILHVFITIERVEGLIITQRPFKKYLQL